MRGDEVPGVVALGAAVEEEKGWEVGGGRAAFDAVDGYFWRCLRGDGKGFEGFKHVCGVP